MNITLSINHTVSDKWRQFEQAERQMTLFADYGNLTAGQGGIFEA